MPTYLYECQKCGHTHEYFQSMSEEPKKKCPDCGGRLVRQIGGGSGVILKGSGFHNTDYRSKGWHSDAKKDSAASSPAPASEKSEKSGSKEGGSKDGGSSSAPKDTPKKDAGGGGKSRKK